MVNAPQALSLPTCLLLHTKLSETEDGDQLQMLWYFNLCHLGSGGGACSSNGFVQQWFPSGGPFPCMHVWNTVQSANLSSITFTNSDGFSVTLELSCGSTLELQSPTGKITATPPTFFIPLATSAACGSGSSHSGGSVIVGGVIGGIAVVALVGGFVWHRQRQQKKIGEATTLLQA